MEGPSGPTMHRDPYEVLSVSRDSTDQEIKTAYRKLALNKLGVLIKTTISANDLEEGLNGTVTVRPLPIGKSISGKVDKQCAHFFGVTISDEQAEFGIVVRVTSTAQSKFKFRVVPQTHHQYNHHRPKI